MQPTTRTIATSPRASGLVTVIAGHDVRRVRTTAWSLHDFELDAMSSSRRRSTPYFVREVLAIRQIEKLVRLFSIRDGFEVFAGVKIHANDHVKPSASTLYIEHGSPILYL